MTDLNSRSRTLLVAALAADAPSRATRERILAGIAKRTLVDASAADGVRTASLSSQGAKTSGVGLLSGTKIFVIAITMVLVGGASFLAWMERPVERVVTPPERLAETDVSPAAKAPRADAPKPFSMSGSATPEVPEPKPSVPAGVSSTRARPRQKVRRAKPKRKAVKPPTRSSLAAESRLLKLGIDNLSRSNAVGALEIVRRYRSEFGDGILAVDAVRLEIKALCTLGRHEEAHERIEAQPAAERADLRRRCHATDPSPGPRR